MPTLHVYGVDQAQLPAFLTSSGDIREVMVVGTCNRTEVYLVKEGHAGTKPLEPLQARDLNNLCPRYHFQDSNAAAHLFAVAASLRSDVPGDTQIAAQVARAARTARIAGTLGPILEHLTAAALRCAKRVSRETGLAAGYAGTGPAVLLNIRRLVPLPPWRAKPVRVLLLGAGAIAEEVAAHLLPSGVPDRGVSRQIVLAGVWAPNKQNAIRFASNHGVPCLSAREAAKSLTEVDVVVCASDGRVALLSEQVLSPVLEARTDPLLILDLGVPHNLDPSLAPRDGLTAIFLDRLQPQTKDQTRIRQTALALAEHIVESESLRFEKWRSTQPGAVRHLRVALHRTIEPPRLAVNQ